MRPVAIILGGVPLARPPGLASLPRAIVAAGLDVHGLDPDGWALLQLGWEIPPNARPADNDNSWMRQPLPAAPLCGLHRIVGPWESCPQ